MLKRQIFIIDNYRINLFILNEYLKDDFKVELFQDSTGCISRMHHECPEIVLLNCESDDENAENIKKIFPNVKIIGTTATYHKEDYDKYFKRGIKHIIVKPIYKQALMSCIVNA